MPPVTTLISDTVRKPAALAVTRAIPVASAVTTPVADTAATEEFELVNATDIPFTRFPSESSGMALRATLPPVDRNEVAGITSSEATPLCDPGADESRHPIRAIADKNATARARAPTGRNSGNNVTRDDKRGR